MPNQEEIAIIQGLRAGGIERRRFENILWKRFSGFIFRGVTKFNLPKDEIRHAYADTICSVIVNIVTGKYEEDSNALLKTYAETIFHYKCVDRITKSRDTINTQNPGREKIKNAGPIGESILEALPDEVKNAIERIIEKEDHFKIQKCLEKTGELCKEILNLYASGYKDKEIAVMMNYSSSDVVKQSRYRCMGKLNEYYLKTFQHE